MSTFVPPVARAEMLIRRPPSDVYRAFVDPAETSNFWFTRGSASLRQGEKVKWYWDGGKGSPTGSLRLNRLLLP
mgnify:CR=1 FL=1